MFETVSGFFLNMFEYFSYGIVGIVFMGILVWGGSRLRKNSEIAGNENVEKQTEIDSTPIKTTEQDRVASLEYKTHYQKFKDLLQIDDMLEFQNNYGYIPYKLLPDPGRDNYRSQISTVQLAKLHVFFDLAYKHYGHTWPNHKPPYDPDLNIKDNGFFYNCRCCGSELIEPEMDVTDGYIYCDYRCYGRGKEIAERTGAR